MTATCRDTAMNGTAEVRERLAILVSAKRARHGKDFSWAELDALFLAAPLPALAARMKCDTAPILPCVLCGDPEGRKKAKCNRPGRSGGEPFGIAGEICLACWSRMEARQRRARLKAAGITRRACNQRKAS